MEISKDLADTLIYFVPAALVMIGMFMLIKRFLDRDYKVHLIDAKVSLQKNSLPLKLQAYERLVLFLERISPSNLLVRISQPGNTASQLHANLLTTIRSEYEHNLSQQIYISSHAWEMVKNAKEDTLKLINNAYSAAGQNASGMQLSSQVFELMLKSENIPTQGALDFLKSEVKQLLG